MKNLPVSLVGFINTETTRMEVHQWGPKRERYIVVERIGAPFTPAVDKNHARLSDDSYLNITALPGWIKVRKPWPPVTLTVEVRDEKLSDGSLVYNVFLCSVIPSEGRDEIEIPAVSMAAAIACKAGLEALIAEAMEVSPCAAIMPEVAPRGLGAGVDLFKLAARMGKASRIPAFDSVKRDVRGWALAMHAAGLYYHIDEDPSEWQVGDSSAGVGTRRVFTDEECRELLAIVTEFSEEEREAYFAAGLVAAHRKA